MRSGAITRERNDPRAWPPDTTVSADPANPADGEAALISQFVRTLLPAEQADVVLRGFYTDALHVALLKRLAALRNESGYRGGPQTTRPLSAWRLKRVRDYVEANLDQRLSLAALASAAGLSRMYFASQFRLATGMSPHDYVVRRRIQSAKAMLSRTDTPIMEVALNVGFQSQSHFTTVFRHIVGYTPQRWRASLERETARGERCTEITAIGE